MIFRIKLHWWSSLLAAGAMVVVARALGGTQNLQGQFSSIGTAMLVGAGAALGCLLVNWMVDRALRIALGASYARRFQEFALDVVGRMRPAEALAGGLMAAAGEEPLFRGVLLPALGLSVWGIAGAAVLFGLAHYLRREYWGFFIWGIGEGVVFGLLYVATGSILVPAVAHGTFDAVGFLYFQRLRRLANRPTFG